MENCLLIYYLANQSITELKPDFAIFAPKNCSVVSTFQCATVIHHPIKFVLLVLCEGQVITLWSTITDFPNLYRPSLTDHLSVGLHISTSDTQPDFDAIVKAQQRQGFSDWMGTCALKHICGQYKDKLYFYIYLYE